MTASAQDIITRASRDIPAAPPDSWRAGLELFMEGLARSQSLLPGARAGIEAYAEASLRARFALEHWLAQHPKAAETPITRPLFILGMPRAGTTLLLNLLRLDPQRRVLWHWEGNREMPPAQAASLHDDPRIAVKVREINAMLDSGALPRNHHVEMGDEPTECIWPLGQDFKAYPWLVQTQVPDYFEWLMHEADMNTAYAYQYRYLQVLQSGAPGAWTLKLPTHALALDSILANFPDARIVMTHRDPIKPVASSCSLCDQILSLQNKQIDKAMLGYQTATLNALGARRMSVVRDAHPDTPFMDIHYKPFTADPMATIRKLYHFEEMELTPEVAAKMQNELDRHNFARNAAGSHRYRLEDYGLDETGLDRMFGDYVSRYGIHLERS